MRMTVLSLIVTSLWLCSCIADSSDQEQPEQEHVGTAESSLLLTTHSPPATSCEGFTSGHGQKVHGQVNLDFIDFASNTWRATIVAENWKQNIGWHRKRTSALRIIGTLTSNGTSICSFDIDTGGDLEDTIATFCDFFADASTVVDARLTFMGRDGTVCSL